MPFGQTRQEIRLVALVFRIDQQHADGVVEQLVLPIEVRLRKLRFRVGAHLEKIRIEAGVELRPYRRAFVARVCGVERSSIDGHLRGTHAGSFGMPGNMGALPAHASAAPTARPHSGTRARAAAAPAPGVNRVNVRPARKSSGLAHTPAATPASPAAPREVVSTRSGRATGTPSTSA